MKLKKFVCLVFFVVLFTVSSSVLANSNHSLNKQSVQSADDFYLNKVDKKDYQEFTNAKLKVRKLIKVQDLPKVFDEKEWVNYPALWKKYQKKSVIEHTKDLSPDEQVYYFFSLKDDGEKIYIQNAMYDATTKKLRSKGFGHWTKEEFKLKFEHK